MKMKKIQWKKLKIREKIAKFWKTSNSIPRLSILFNLLLKVNILLYSSNMERNLFYVMQSNNCNYDS